MQPAELTLSEQAGAGGHESGSISLMTILSMLQDSSRTGTRGDLRGCAVALA